MPDDRQHPVESPFDARSTAAEVAAAANLKGRTVVVTGGYSGIGLETTRALEAAGARVIVTVRSPEKAQDALSGLTVETVALDLSEPESIETGARALRDLTADGIDILINNAGTAGEKSWNPQDDKQSIGSIDYNQWRWIMEVNLLGAMRMTEALAENVAASERKLVAMISSGLASIEHNTMGGSHLYRTSKAALNMLAKGVAIDLAGRGVTTIALSPGWTQTDMGGPDAHHTTEESVTKQREVIARLTPADNGKFYDLMGAEVPW